jgi:hypothetical protein
MPKKQLTVHLEADTFVQIQERSAAGGRGPSEVLRRRLEMLDSLIVQCDPRVTRGFPDAFHAFLVSYLTAPWAIPADRIVGLEAYIAQKPGFAEACGRAGIDPAELRQAVRGLSFAEKLALIDAAEAHQTHAHQAHVPAARPAR